MALTLNNIDLGRKNNLNIVSVEDEYDKAMRTMIDDPAWTVYLLGQVRSKNQYQAYQSWKSLSHAERDEARDGFAKLGGVLNEWFLSHVDVEV